MELDLLVVVLVDDFANAAAVCPQEHVCLQEYVAAGPEAPPAQPSESAEITELKR
jgi:hypothetical protein